MRTGSARRSQRFPLRRFVADAAFGLALFVFAISVAGESGPAGAARLESIPAVSTTTGQIAAHIASKPGLVSTGIVAGAVDETSSMALVATLKPIDRRMPMFVLALVFSGLLAMNMALFRHMRRTAPQPRRGAI